MTCFLSRFAHETVILLALAIVLASGFLATRAAKLCKLPKVSGYILAGILIGPHLINLVPQEVVEGMSFVSDIALAFIAFGVGKFFKKETLKETGASVIVVTLFESLTAGALVTLSMLAVFHLDLKLSLLLGAIATATAPASTIMTIKQYHARGRFVDTLLQIVALDDVVCLLVFSIVSAVASAGDAGARAMDVLLPIVFNGVAIGLGALAALLLHRLLWPHRSADNRLIIVVAMLLALSGLCSIFDVSPLLCCMVFGAVYVNKADDQELFRQIDAFTPPIMLLFFVVSGMNLDLKVLTTFGLVGVGYFLIRIAGKYAGAYLGCLAVKSDRSIRDYLGVALVPQAGVAIGLACLSQRILPPEIGNVVMTIILASSVLYELIGPACAKFALVQSGAIAKKALEKDEKPAGGLICADKHSF